MTARDKLQELSPFAITAIGITSVIIVGAADSVTGREISFSVLYLVPVAFVVWYAGKTRGIIAAVLSVMAWVISDLITGAVLSSYLIHIWNAVSRLAIYTVVALLISRLKDYQFELERTISESTIDLSIEKIDHKRTFESVKRLSLFPELNPNPILEIDKSGTLTYCNKAADDYLSKSGVTADYSVFYPDDIEKIFKELADGSQNVFYREKKIGEIYFEEHIYLVRNFNVIQIYAAEITDRKKAEEITRKSLKEKEILIREIHHRVKNNLQIISSLLKLQSAFLKDKEGLSVIVESQRRIGSIASIHQMLYKEGDVARIDATKFLGELVKKLYELYETGSVNIIFDIRSENVIIPADIANPLGLIVTEIISNSFKYAFAGMTEGNIFISITCDNENNYELEIGDNGIGIKQNVDKDKTATLGLHLIDMLSKQIEAKYSVDNTGGTKFKFNFRSTNTEE